MEGTPPPGPGWYPDPNDPNTNRYWDGQGWTESRAPAVGPGAPGSGARTSGMAIASLVLGLLWGYGVGSVLAIIFGVVAKNQIRDGQGQVTGGGMATAGIVLGIIGAVIAVIVIIAVATAGDSGRY
jgi:hypothetical protein